MAFCGRCDLPALSGLRRVRPARAVGPLRTPRVGRGYGERYPALALQAVWRRRVRVLVEGSGVHCESTDAKSAAVEAGTQSVAELTVRNGLFLRFPGVERIAEHRGRRDPVERSPVLVAVIG